jgi:hypothetical protein
VIVEIANVCLLAVLSRGADEIRGNHMAKKRKARKTKKRKTKPRKRRRILGVPIPGTG